jgi:DNA-binding MarR family transcriptional regulator
MEALAAIINSPSLSAQVDIAKRLRIEGPTMTRMLDTLEADGLVERCRSGRPAHQAAAADAEGEKVLEEIFAIADELRDRLLDGVAPERMDELNALLVMLTERMDSGTARVRLRGEAQSFSSALARRPRCRDRRTRGTARCSAQACMCGVGNGPRAPRGCPTAPRPRTGPGSATSSA